MGGNTLLMAADKVHGNEPLNQRQFGVLEDSTHETRKVLEAVVATEATIATLAAMVCAAVGANHVAVAPTRIDDCLLAFLLGIEIGGERNDVVESAKVHVLHIAFIGL
jgi:hypothetical protein